MKGTEMSEHEIEVSDEAIAQAENLDEEKRARKKAAPKPAVKPAPSSETDKARAHVMAKLAAR